MKILKKRINSLSYLDNIPDGEPIIVGINNVERFSPQCLLLGFPTNIENGTRLLPNNINPTTRRNAEPFSVPDRSKPMETAYRTQWWIRREWAGRGETREVSEYVDIPYKRYPRIAFPPFSVELTFQNENGNNRIVSDPLIFNEDNKPLIKNTINIFLTVFGECEIYNKNLEKCTPQEVIRLNWDILPPGEYPWNKVQSDIKKLISQATETNQKIMLEKCEYIESFVPDFRAYGRSGFRGYVIFGFKSKNYYVLESIYPNNATYVFNENWQELSKLSKAEILNGGLHNTRLIHHESWKNNIKALLDKIKNKGENENE